MSQKPKNDRLDSIMVVTNVRWVAEFLKVMVIPAVGLLVWLNITYLDHDVWVSAFATIVGLGFIVGEAFSPKRFIGTRTEVINQLITYDRPPDEVALRRVLTEGVAVSEAIEIIAAANNYFCSTDPEKGEERLRGIVRELIEAYNIRNPDRKV